MNLNQTRPDLPDWPTLDSVGSKGEFVVRGDHISYGSFHMLEAFFPFLPVKLLCRLFFKTHTVVRFTPSQIKTGNGKYAIDNGVPVQFRASRPHMKEEDYNALNKHLSAGSIPRSAGLRLMFRRVEMIYGSKIVHITSIDDPDRAQQFAIVLQVAYELALTHDMKAVQMSPRKPTRESALPE